ncbi:MAG: lipopolysaccharide heptosyltransferase [Stygiobacter sp.]|nr:MAG: lipopolysaccharide heptosyltransferase [Stygiobacter sp.]KAF0216124.1 MAG: lipopolysaccharide [Ignavibacteria bacterium]
MSTAAIRAIKQSFPESVITLLVRSEYKDVLSGNKNIDGIITYDLSIKKIRGWERLKTEFNFVKYLRGKKYDAVVSLQAGDRYVFWSFFSGAKVRVAPIENNFGFLLTTKAKVFEEKISYLDYYLKIAEAFGAEIVTKKLDFTLDEQLENWAAEFLNAKGISAQDKIVGIHPGASEPTKMWSIENYLKLVDIISKDVNTKVILFLGPMEKKKSIFNDVLKSKVVVADTSESIQHLAWLLSKCSLLICNDSGTRHLSAALKIPTITLFPDDKIVPWKFYTEEDGQFFILGKRNTSNPGKTFLDSITVEEVFQKVKEILN